MAKRETLMLATLFDCDRHSISGKYMSEKIDGIRAWWDGGESRGKHVSEVAYANIRLSGGDDYCTGLWSRYFKVIHAPKWWISCLPLGICLDGELDSCGGVQQTNSICRSKLSDKGWDKVRYRVFDSPSLGEVLTPGEVNNPNCKLTIDCDYPRLSIPFFDRLSVVTNLSNSVVSPVEHLLLSDNYSVANDQLDQYLSDVLHRGGEGVMLRGADSLWVPKRSNDLLKVKPFDEEIGIVIEVLPGLGRLSGMMGSLVVSSKGVCFSLGTGFTDSDRDIVNWKTGDRVRYRYRALSDLGVPKEARYISRV